MMWLELEIYVYNVCIREENISRPLAKNQPKGWNGRLPTQLTGHQADQSWRYIEPELTACSLCLQSFMSMRNYVCKTGWG